MQRLILKPIVHLESSRSTISNNLRRTGLHKRVGYFNAFLSIGPTSLTSEVTPLILSQKCLSPKALFLSPKAPTQLRHARPIHFLKTTNAKASAIFVTSDLVPGNEVEFARFGLGITPYESPNFLFYILADPYWKDDSLHGIERERHSSLY